MMMKVNGVITHATRLKEPGISSVVDGADLMQRICLTDHKKVIKLAIIFRGSRILSLKRQKRNSNVDSRVRTTYLESRQSN